MLNMFTFDVFSIYHSLDQSVTVVALFIFCLVSQEYNLSFIQNI